MDARKPQNSRVGPFPGLGQLRTWALSDSDLARSPGRLPTQSGRCVQGTGKQGQQPPTLHPSSFSQEEKPSSALFLHRVHSPREAPGAGGVTPQGSRDTNRKGPREGRMEGTMASVSGTGVHSGHGEGQGAGAAPCTQEPTSRCVWGSHTLTMYGAWLPHSDCGHDDTPPGDAQRTG